MALKEICALIKVTKTQLNNKYAVTISLHDIKMTFSSNIENFPVYPFTKLGKVLVYATKISLMAFYF